MHVRLAERERVDIRLVVQIRETVVDEPVRALVAPHSVKDVEQRGVSPEAPIVLGDLGCGEVLPVIHTIRQPRGHTDEGMDVRTTPGCDRTQGP